MNNGFYDKDTLPFWQCEIDLI